MPNTDRNILSDIIHFHSQFYRPRAVEPNADYAFVTPMGSFRMAYLPEAAAKGRHKGDWGSQALFYARHVDDLTAERVPAVPTANDPRDYRLKIKHPKRLILLEIKNRRHSEDAEFDANNRHIHLDCSSLLKRIYDSVQYIPRIQLREASLHGMGSEYVSAHIGVFPEDQDEDGLRRISVSTRIHTNHGFHTTTPTRTQQMAFRVSMLKALGKLSPDSKIMIAARNAAEENVLRDRFEPGELVSAILENAQQRIDAISEGNDPDLVARKRHRVRMHRLAETAHLRAHEMGQSLRHPRSAVREVTDLGAKATSIYTALLQLFVNQAFADPRVSEYIPANWHDAVRTRRHMLPLTSDIQEFMMLPEKSVFQDFEWLDPAMHRPSFAEDQKLKPSDPRSNFQNWLISHFLAPYCAVFDYYGAFEDFSHMQSMAEVRLIREETNNGLQLFYDTGQKRLHAFYSREGFDPLKRLLPLDAPAYFNDNEVLTCNMADFGEPMEAISYNQFKADISRFGISPERLRLRPPQQPATDVINDPERNALPPHISRPALRS